MVKQRAVDAGANEVRRILQGGSTSRPAFSDVPPPDRLPGSITAGGQPLQAAAQVQQGTPAQHGHFAPQAAAAQQPPQAAQTVPLYVGVEAAPSFNLHQRLRGPGALVALITLHCLRILPAHLSTCFAEVQSTMGFPVFVRTPVLSVAFGLDVGCPFQHSASMEPQASSSVTHLPQFCRGQLP